MINIEATTKIPKEELILCLKDYFGSEGHGLEITEEESCLLCFSGNGGMVRVTVSPWGGRTRIRLMAQDWEPQAREFISFLP